MEQKNLKNILESLLFVATKPLKAENLAIFLEIDAEPIKAALEELKKDRLENGIILLESNGEYQLATNAANSTFVKNFLNAELREKLTDASVEVLAIIAYRQPISKSEIEAVRGVNSQYSIRSLLMRGLVEKISNPLDGRSFLYQTTTDFLQQMGLTSVKDLPEFEKLVSQIKLPQTPELERENSAPDSTEDTKESQT